MNDLYGPIASAIDRHAALFKQLGPYTTLEGPIGIGPNAPHIFFVDPIQGNDGGQSGCDPQFPFLTVGFALTKVVNTRGDTIMVIGANGSTSGNVNIDEGVTTPASVHSFNIVNALTAPGSVTWKQSKLANTVPCLVLQGSAVRVYGFRFSAPTGASAVQFLRTASVAGHRARVVGCEFNTGQFGIESNGGEEGPIVEDCFFHDITSAAANAGAIVSTSTAQAVPLHWLIDRCRFVNNKNHVTVPMNDSIVRASEFLDQGNSITTTTKLDISGGAGHNIVHDNIFGGTYSIAGGYKAGTSDIWARNWQTAGVTSAVPV